MLFHRKHAVQRRLEWLYATHISPTRDTVMVGRNREDYERAPTRDAMTVDASD